MKKELHSLPLDHLTNPFHRRQAVFYSMVRTLLNCSFLVLLKPYVIRYSASHVHVPVSPLLWGAEVTHGSNCMLGNNRIAGLFTVLFISNACHHLLQQPKPSILSFIATFAQAENCTEYSSVLFIYFPKVISGSNRFNCQQNTWL